jgi:hypothetical protein
MRGSHHVSQDIQKADGAQGRNRTTDTAIFSRMLYQLSYLGVVRAGLGLGRRGV